MCIVSKARFKSLYIPPQLLSHVSISDTNNHLKLDFQSLPPAQTMHHVVQWSEKENVGMFKGVSFCSSHKKNTPRNL